MGPRSNFGRKEEREQFGGNGGKNEIFCERSITADPKPHPLQVWRKMPTPQNHSWVRAAVKRGVKRGENKCVCTQVTPGGEGVTLCNKNLLEGIGPRSNLLVFDSCIFAKRKGDMAEILPVQKSPARRGGGRENNPFLQTLGAKGGGGENICTKQILR